jgi:demethylmenaquinone methyltransferase / 2-methoxy-6-polyprenyl-1,4-benzoquinol methylase
MGSGAHRLHSRPVETLPDPRPTRAKDSALVQQMFDRVAPRYDLANTVLSAGQDRHWRRVAVRALGAAPGALVLDVAAGTGMLSLQLCAAGARVLAIDLSWRMLQVGARRDRSRSSGHGQLWWCNADALRLPLTDASCDGVAIAFGLRNLPDPAAGLTEFARVVRPGGRLVVLEFSRPAWAPFRAAYASALRHGVPAVARLVSSDPASYRYLAESILAWPDQPALARIIAEAGWTSVRWKSLSGGMVAVHQATRPPRPAPERGGG